MRVVSLLSCTLINETTLMIGTNSSEAIKVKSIKQKPSLPIKKPPVEVDPVFVNVCFLYRQGELQGGNRGAKNLKWS